MVSPGDGRRPRCFARPNRAPLSSDGLCPDTQGVPHGTNDDHTNPLPPASGGATHPGHTGRGRAQLLEQSGPATPPPIVGGAVGCICNAPMQARLYFYTAHAGGVRLASDQPLLEEDVRKLPPSEDLYTSHRVGYCSPLSPTQASAPEGLTEVLAEPRGRFAVNVVDTYVKAL